MYINNSQQLDNVHKQFTIIKCTLSIGWSFEQARLVQILKENQNRSSDTKSCNTPLVKPEDPTKKMFQVKTF